MYSVTLKPSVMPIRRTPFTRKHLSVAVVATLLSACGGRERSVTITPSMVERYGAAYHAHLEGITRYCRDKQVRAFEMSVEEPFDEAVLELLRRGGFLR